jgi:hypothetical protein
MNLVSLFQFRFVKSQFKENWVMYGFHMRIVAKTLTVVENRKNRVRWFRNRLHWTMQEQWNFSLCKNPSFIIVSAETEYISTRSWYRNINFKTSNKANLFIALVQYHISSENIILFHCSCIVQCSLFRNHRTRFFLFSKIEKIVCDDSEIDYTGQCKSNGIK